MPYREIDEIRTTYLCHTCNRTACTCNDTEEVPASTPSRLRIRVPRRLVTEDGVLPTYICSDCGRESDSSGCVCENTMIREMVGQTIQENCPPQTEALGTRYPSTPTWQYEGTSIPYMTSEHERELYLHCDNSCGAIMCAVCMANLDYYLDF